MTKLGWGAIFTVMIAAVLFLPTIIRLFRTEISPDLIPLYEDKAPMLIVEYFPIFWLLIPLLVIGIVLYARHQGGGEE